MQLRNIVTTAMLLLFFERSKADNFQGNVLQVFFFSEKKFSFNRLIYFYKKRAAMKKISRHPHKHFTLFVAWFVVDQILILNKW